MPRRKILVSLITDQKYWSKKDFLALKTFVVMPKVLNMVKNWETKTLETRKCPSVPSEENSKRLFASKNSHTA